MHKNTLLKYASVALIVLLGLHFLLIWSLKPYASALAIGLFFVALAVFLAPALKLVSEPSIGNNRTFRIGSVILLLCGANLALEFSAPSMPPRNNVAIVGGDIITGRTASELITNGTVLIDDTGTITAVGDSKRIAVPDDYEVIDASGKFIMPGLINAHSHSWRDAGNPDLPYDLTSFAPPGLAHDLSVYSTRTYVGQRVIASRIEQNTKKQLLTGVTTVREIGNMEFLDVAFRDQVANGKRIGPNFIVAGKILATTGGHSAEVGIVFDGPVEARRAVREALRQRVDLIKITGTGGVSDSRRLGEAGELQMTLAEMQAIMDEAHRRNVLVTVHAESSQGVKEALLAGADNIEHGAILDDETIALFKNNPKSLRGFSSLHPTLSIFGSGVDWTDEAKADPALVVIGRNTEMVAESLIAGFKQAVDNDVLVGLGTDSGFASHEMVWKELKYFKKFGGVTSSEAIHMGTLATALSIGVADVTGSIEKGKRADLLILNGDPRENLSLIGEPLAVFVSGYAHHLAQ